MNLFGSVKKLKIFEGVDDSIVQKIINSSEREVFSTGQIIMEQGEDSNGKGYIIESGCVDIFINGAQTTTLQVGDIFGEIALLNEEPRTATIIAQKQVGALILTQDTLFHMIEHDDNSINKEIMRRMEENLESE